jgi:hypothetical protein
MASIVPITGGLGNQLFQYTFAKHLEICKGIKARIDCRIGNPRKVEGSVALQELINENDRLYACQERLRLDRVSSRIYGWNLVSRLAGFERSRLEQFVISILSKIVFFFRYKQRYILAPSTNLGFDKTVSPENKCIYFGYFQTFRYASETKVYEHLMSLSPKIKSGQYFCIKKSIENASNVLVHLRFTDYLKESKFGIPSISYYRNALNLMGSKLKVDSVWVVTDDVAMAKNYLKDLSVPFEVKFMEQDAISDLEVWDLMRDFSGYIISNSTFAWWAAFLRRKIDAPVYAPDPWFKGMEDPKDLIPESWIKVTSL